MTGTKAKTAPLTIVVVDGDTVAITAVEHGRPRVEVGRSLMNGRSAQEVFDLASAHAAEHQE